MKKVENPQNHFGKTAIVDIYISSKSRDDIPAQLICLQLIYTKERWCQRVFELLLEKVRPGMVVKVG